ncbi:YraN family protein [Microbacterium sp. W1N]|uniref:YraN family protein n=1 Tax=Microbacterium festucae TaxID=2977531 RepID=UPI0021BEEBB6|nr:YraN family protein [Microbacterium festucae]MCT9820307.1 YraN family protein [Microbacterium festucae]
MADKDERGRAGEDRAAAHLHARGWRILDRNWRCPIGEIDIVAEQGRDLIVVEVKTRRSEAYGHPFAAVDERKRRRLWKLARAWCLAHPDLAHARVLRLDLIGIIGDDPAVAALEHLEDLR